MDGIIYLTIEPVQHTREEQEASLRELDRLGVDIEVVGLLKGERTKPHDHSGEQFTDEDNTG